MLSDTLPFELPVSFGNRHFFEVLRSYDVQIVGSRLRWESASDVLDDFIYVITGIARTNPIVTSQATEFGKRKSYRYLEFGRHDLVKVPFQFSICHRSKDARTLSVPHPFSQIAVANFYNDHADSLIYYAGRSPFSIRRPDSVARFSNFRDRMHERLLAPTERFEEADREYNQVGSFFVYRAVNNVFKFFESFRYHRAEKRFDAMAQVDVSKCFDSIYTHTAPWALLGKQAVKDDIANSGSTFAAKFDKLMQSVNHNETNGIIIGPEFSRVFAETILQSVDVKVERDLRTVHSLLHKKDYEVFRYVDDYFIFYNASTDIDLIIDHIRGCLADVKLSVNPDKTKIYEKPVITEITIAKAAISNLLKSLIVSEAAEIPLDAAAELPGEGVQISREFHSRVVSRDLIIGYKTILKSANVTYLDVGNFTFALLESAIDKTLSDFAKSDEALRSEKALVSALISVLEFIFFIYAASPRVNLSVRLTRIVSVCARALRRLRVNPELRHHIFKYVNDNAVHQLRKNQTADFKEVETLYLLTALGELGREYWLTEDTLCRYLRIAVAENGILSSPVTPSHLTITVALLYMRRKARYNKLRAFLIGQIEHKIAASHAYCHKDTETLILFLDTLACPYIPAVTKTALGVHFGLNVQTLAKVQSVSANWFTTWTGFDLVKELDAKRYRDVY